MKFENRVVETPNRYRIVETEEYNIVDLIREEGGVILPGTPVNEDLFAKVNGREDAYLEFTPGKESDLANKDNAKTQIYTNTAGETVVSPPTTRGAEYVLAKKTEITSAVTSLQSKITTAENNLNAAKFPYTGGTITGDVKISSGKTLTVSKIVIE